jgi:hypothetical protein
MMFRSSSDVGPMLEGVRAALEDNLLALSDRADLVPLADALRSAIATLSQSIEADTLGHDDKESLERAAASIKAAKEKLLGDDDALGKRIDGAARWLSEATDKLHARMPMRMMQAASPAPKERPEIFASVGVPRAHPAEVPPPRVLSREEAADRTRGRVAFGSSGNTSGERAQIEAIARDGFEDLGSLGNLRRLYEHEPWIDAAKFEQRLLDNLDALISLEVPLDPAMPSLGLVEAAFAYATEWTIPDYGRTFTLAFTLCCLDDETAMRWVVLALRRSNPRTYPAFVDACVLGSNPGVDRTLVELCRDDDPALVEVALEAMARRGRADVASVVLLLMRPSTPSLIGKAIELATRLPAATAVPLLARLLDGADPFVATNAAAALLTLGDARGEKHLRAVLQRPRNDDPAQLSARRAAFEALCLLGSPFDRNLVATEASLDREGLSWLGWHGHPDHVPVLIEAARRAFAAGSYDEIGPIASALERIGGGAAPRPTGLGPAEFDERLAAFLRAFEERRPQGANRMRFGRLFSPSAVVAELAARDTKQGIRPRLARELALHTQRVVHFDAEGWVAAQERALAAARELMAKLA